MFRMKKTAMEIVRSMETKPAMIDMGTQVLRKWSSRLPRQPSCTQSWCARRRTHRFSPTMQQRSRSFPVRRVLSVHARRLCVVRFARACAHSDRTVLNVGRRLCELLDSKQTSVVPLPETTKPHPEVGPSSPARRWGGSLGAQLGRYGYCPRMSMNRSSIFRLPE